MAESEEIVAEVRRLFGSDSLAGETVLITAGGTAEPIDAVRSLTNRSSGKMGFALAEEAAYRGARVCLVAGTTALPTPGGVERVDVETAMEMREAVLSRLEAATVVIKAAAVADFRPETRQEQKIKKASLASQDGITLRLITNPDILAEVCAQKGDRFVVGFAAESEDVIESALRKIKEKGCDLLVANDISRTDAGFNVDTNSVHLLTPEGEIEEIPLSSKREIAGQVLDRVQKLRNEKSS